MEHITAIIASGDFTQFIGMPEDAVLEVKRQPYDLDIAAGRYELAKDVSALANSGGGYIVTGLITRREADREIDIVDALSLLAEATFPMGQHQGVIANHIFPTIDGLCLMN